MVARVALEREMWRQEKNGVSQMQPPSASRRRSSRTTMAKKHSIERTKEESTPRWSSEPSEERMWRWTYSTTSSVRGKISAPTLVKVEDEGVVPTNVASHLEIESPVPMVPLDIMLNGHSDALVSGCNFVPSTVAMQEADEQCSTSSICPTKTADNDTTVSDNCDSAVASSA
ncbi:hypothetical protein EDD85DRAFT_786723 [Armillaria nabsnona]|nr:hypothetical protein EDD85DRAFT_786723 [Armillaria nabsnona]